MPQIFRPILVLALLTSCSSAFAETHTHSADAPHALSTHSHQSNPSIEWDFLTWDYFKSAAFHHVVSRVNQATLRPLQQKYGRGAHLGACFIGLTAAAGARALTADQAEGALQTAADQAYELMEHMSFRVYQNYVAMPLAPGAGPVSPLYLGSTSSLGLSLVAQLALPTADQVEEHFATGGPGTASSGAFYTFSVGALGVASEIAQEAAFHYLISTVNHATFDRIEDRWGVKIHGMVCIAGMTATTLARAAATDVESVTYQMVDKIDAGMKHIGFHLFGHFLAMPLENRIGKITTTGLIMAIPFLPYLPFIGDYFQDNDTGESSDHHHHHHHDHR